MIRRLMLFLLISNLAVAFNFSPLPKSFTDTIQISPKYGVFSFRDLTFNPSSGTFNDLLNTFGFGIKWGDPFDGLSFEFDFVGSINISSLSSTEFTTTSFNSQMYKLRYHYKLIDDGYGKMALFSSFGMFQGNYIVKDLSESSGVTSYVERLIAGTLVDLGVSFSYILNPEWELFLTAFYQLSINESITNIAGASVSGPGIDLTGASIQVGTSLEL